MVHKIIFTTIFFFNIYIISGQNRDSLIHFRDIKFHSDFEKKAFKHFFIENDTNYFELFSAVDSNMTKEKYTKYRNKFYEFQKGIGLKKIRKKKKKKKISLLHEKIHELYLDKYDEIVYFPDVFKSGSYNCVTASMIFGLIFYQEKIPFQAEVTTNHVLLMTYPNDEAIQVETTDTKLNLPIFDNNFKRNYANYLRKTKAINEAEYKNSTSKQIFEKHFFAEKNTSLKGLAGIQYSNLGINFIKKIQYKKAYRSFEKSYILYPSEKTRFLLFFSLIYILHQSDYFDINDIDYLCKAMKYKEFGITNKDIINEFYRITNKQFHVEGNIELYDSIHKRLILRLKNDDLKKDISFIYYAEIGNYFMQNADLNNALENFGNAYKLKPQSIVIENLIINLIEIELSSVHEKQKRLDIVNKYITKYPDLKKNKKLIRRRYYSHLDFMMRAYNNENPEDGEKYRKLFENDYIIDKEYKSLDYLIEIAYISAANYMLKKRKKEKARNILLKGLEYIPESKELNKKLKSIKLK